MAEFLYTPRQSLYAAGKCSRIRQVAVLKQIYPTHLCNACFVRRINKNWRIVINIWHTNDYRNVSITARRWFNCARYLLKKQKIK